MLAPAKSYLSKDELNRILNDFPSLKIELVWDCSDPKKIQGTFQSNDFTIVCYEFNIQVELYIQEKGIITPASYYNPQEYNRTSLDVEIGDIKLIPDDSSEVEISEKDYKALKKKIITEINKEPWV